MLRDIIKLIRVKHWIKNLLVIAPLIFSFNMFNVHLIYEALYVFAGFCFLSSSIYIINDLMDIENDRNHPQKKSRPLASGAIRVATARLILLLFVCFVIIIATRFTNAYVAFIFLFYAILNISYSLFLKNISIIDCICIAIGFELRILAGCFAITVLPSDFILLVTFFLALTLSFIKRKGELKVMSENASLHRKALSGYTIDFLNKIITICATITIIGYLFYTIEHSNTEIVNNKNLKFSTIFVVYGIFRFMQLSEIDIYKNEGDPTNLIFADRGLQITLALWGVCVAYCIYGS